MTTTKMQSVLSQLAIGTLNSIGWISDGSSRKAYEGVLIDVTSGKRGLRLTICVNRATGRTVTVNWRMSQSEAETIVQAYDRMQIDSQYGVHPNQRLTIVSRYLDVPQWVATVYGYACELCAV